MKVFLFLFAIILVSCFRPAKPIDTTPPPATQSRSLGSDPAYLIINIQQENNYSVSLNGETTVLADTADLGNFLRNNKMKIDPKKIALSNRPSGPADFTLQTIDVLKRYGYMQFTVFTSKPH